MNASHSCISRERVLCPEPPRVINRREFLWRHGGGLGGIALAWLLGRNGLLAGTSSGAAPGAGAALNDGLHHPAKAKRVVQLFMSGAASQCDTFDYKPRLIRDSGKPFDVG